MTQAEFTAFYTQFAGFTPAVVLTEYIRQANDRFASFTEEDTEEARRLYTAHTLTMYARVALPDGGEPPATASGGNLAGGEVTGNGCPAETPGAGSHDRDECRRAKRRERHWHS